MAISGWMGWMGWDGMNISQTTKNTRAPGGAKNVPIPSKKCSIGNILNGFPV